jgi:hypothetical protein
MIDMYTDYCRGMSQLEMERKYNRDYKSISRKCKQLTVRMFNDEDSFLFRHLDQVKRDVENSICHINRCPVCGQEKDYLVEE